MSETNDKLFDKYPDEDENMEGDTDASRMFEMNLSAMPKNCQAIVRDLIEELQIPSIDRGPGEAGGITEEMVNLVNDTMFMIDNNEQKATRENLVKALEAIGNSSGEYSPEALLEAKRLADMLAATKGTRKLLEQEWRLVGSQD